MNEHVIAYIAHCGLQPTVEGWQLDILIVKLRRELGYQTLQENCDE